MSQDIVWESNCQKVADILKDADDLESATSSVKVLGQSGDCALTSDESGITDAQALGQLMDNLVTDAYSEVDQLPQTDGIQRHRVQELEVWLQYKEYFPTQANIRRLIGSLEVHQTGSNTLIR